MMTLFLVTFVAILVIFLFMALGAIFGRPAIKGSCGGAGECLCAQSQKTACEKTARDQEEKRHAA